MQWNIVPQLFYDMIGRFCPGAIVLLTAWIVHMIHRAPSNYMTLFLTQLVEITKSHQLLFYSALALIAYFVADMLFQFWKIFTNINRKLKKSTESVLYEDSNNYFSQWIKLKNLLYKNSNSLNITYSQIECIQKYILFDYLRIHAPDVAIRLLKVKAEHRLSSVIVVGYFLVFSLNILYMFLDELYIETFCIGLILFTCILLSWYRANSSHFNYENGVVISWLICIYDRNERSIQLDS